MCQPPGWTSERWTGCSAWSWRPPWPCGGSGRAQAPAERLVVLAVGPHVGRQRRVPARLGRPARVRERAPQAEVCVVVNRVSLDDGGEFLGGLLEAARAEVGPPQRLADRALVGLERARPLERDRSGHEVAGLEQLAAFAKQLVCAVSAHRSPSTVVVAVRSASTASRIAAATVSFGPSGTWRSPSALTIVTSLSATSKPISAREMSLTTIASRPL